MKEDLALKCETDDSALWQTRAAAWELLALSFRYPDDVLASAISLGEWADAALEIASALECELPETFEQDIRFAHTEDAQVLLHKLRAEATRLFVGAPDPVCSPYEGVWRAADDGVQALLFVNPHSMDVERFCKSCGLGRPEGTNEPLDYIATECELLEHLALSVFMDSTEKLSISENLSSGSQDDAYFRFLKEHALTWMPRFAKAVIKETQQPFYRATAMFLQSVANSALDTSTLLQFNS